MIKEAFCAYRYVKIVFMKVRSRCLQIFIFPLIFWENHNLVYCINPSEYVSGTDGSISNIKKDYSKSIKDT